MTHMPATGNFRLSALLFSVSAIGLYTLQAHAGPYEVGAAKGMMIAGIVYEKCTGQPPIRNETERQFQMLLAQGFTPEDIKLGFMQGMLHAENAYPGKSKPPKNECAKATALHKEALKFMQ